MLRAWWDGARSRASKPRSATSSGSNLGQYVIYEIGYPGLLARPVAELLLRHALPEERPHDRDQRRHAGGQRVLLEHRLHRRLRCPPMRCTSTRSTGRRRRARRRKATAPKLNPDGKLNYVYAETRGRGHLMGVTLGVLIRTPTAGWAKATT